MLPLLVEVEPEGILPLLAEEGATSSPPTTVEAEPAGTLPLLAEVGGASSPPKAVEAEPAASCNWSNIGKTRSSTILCANFLDF
ncbi:UNVERIFIED_CONTAM: hypothetical protein FKN15_027303 [Acipenser sinensis]